MSRPLARALAGCAAAVALTALAAVPAQAAPPNTERTRTSGYSLFTSWTETDPAVGVFGNTHVGYLNVDNFFGGYFAFGSIDDYTCDPGEVPGGGHGDPTGTCEFVGNRQLFGDAVTVTVDSKLMTAKMTGSLQVSAGHDGTPLAVVGADVTWTGVGDTWRSTASFRDVTPTGTFVSKYTYINRQATMSGTLGPMNFTDDADDVSTGSIAAFKQTSRSKIG